MANPQCENGYTKIANELFEAIYTKLTNSTWIRIMYHTVRITYGWHRKETQSNYQSYATKLNLTRDTIKAILNELMDRKLIVLVVLTKEQFVITINKDYELWKI